MTRKFDVIAIGTGSAASAWRRAVAKQDGRLRLLIRGRSEVPVRYAGATQRRYSLELQKPLTGLVE
jgi:hypothetical protein